MANARFRASGAAVAALLGLAAVSGCGTSASTSTSSAHPSAEPATYTSAELATFTAYTGAKAGKADQSLSPIHIGAVNQDTGTGAEPELTRFLQAGVGLINDQLSGIDGHPLEVTTCDVTSPETGQACAQKFANDSSIVAVVQSTINAGSDSFHSVMDASGIPIISALPVSPVDGTAKNAYYTASGSFSATGTFIALITQQFKAHSVALIIPSGDPVSAEVGAGLAKILSASGISVKTVNFAPSDPDPTAALLAAGVNNADVILPAVVNPASCLATAKVLATLNAKAPVIALSSCASSQVSDALGDLPKWTYLFGFDNPDAPATDATTKAQVAAYDAWYKPQGETQYGVIGLQVALTLQRHILAGGGAKATPATIAAAAKAWTGPVFMGPATVDYGTQPFPAVPTLAGSKAYTYDGDKTWTPLLGGAWLGAAPQQP